MVSGLHFACGKACGGGGADSRRGQVPSDLAGYPDGQQLQERNNGQRIFKGCDSGSPVGDAKEQTASKASAQKQPEFVVEDIGVLIAPFDPGDDVDHLQLDGVIGEIQQWFGQQQTADEDEHSYGIEKQGIGDCPKKEKEKSDREDEDAMPGRADAPGEIKKTGGKDPADGLRGSQGSLLANQKHDQHCRRGNDVSLRQAFQKSQLQHPPPQRMKMEVNESRPLRIAESAPLENDGGQSCETEDHYCNDVVGTIGDPAEPSVQRSAADE
jgi:hypothetical protein